MPRALFRRGALALVGAASLAYAGRSALRQEQPYEIHAVAGNVSVLSVPGGGNIGLCAGPDGLVLVDDHLASQRETVLAALRKRDSAIPRFVLNTHWHADHTGNNEPFGVARVPIVAHAAARERLAGDPARAGRVAEDTPAAALPTVTYKDSLELFLNGERIELRHLGPGHTDGDSVVWFHGSKVVHLGDLCFQGRFPFIDTGSGGDPDGYVAALGQVVDSIGDDWKFIPGHGPVGTKADLARTHAGLSDCVARVRAALAQGKTVEEMVAENLLADYQAWSWSFISTERFLGDLATALAKPGAGR